MKASLQLKRGIWHVVIYYKDEAGKYKAKWVSTKFPERGNKKAAKEILEKEVEKFEKELSNKATKLEDRKKPKKDMSAATKMFSAYLLEYVKSIEDKVTPGVYKNYHNYHPPIFREYFDKRNIRLIDVTTEDIIGFLDWLREEKKLKASSRRQFAYVMRPALKLAYLDKLIPDNPFDKVGPLPKSNAKMSYYDQNEMSKLFEVINEKLKDKPFLKTYLKMAAYYGTRRSELLGLRWNSVNFDNNTFNINHKVLEVGKNIYFSDVLKTKTSYRTLPLMPAIVEELKELKAITEENKKFLGEQYNIKYEDYVFVYPDGGIVRPEYVSTGFKLLLKRNGLRHIRLHDLRHSCASIMLANGVNIKEIQEYLGHSNYSTTADVYSHLDFSAKQKSAAKIFGAIKDTAHQAIEETDNLEAEMKEVMLKAKALGFDSLKQYIDYLSAAPEEDKDDMQM